MATQAGTETSLSWDFGDGTFGEGRGVSHRHEQPGIYRVALWADNGQCSDNRQQDITVVSSEILTGITAPDAKETLVLFPNPASGWLNIRFPNASIDKPELLELYDMTGRVVQRETIKRTTQEGILHVPLICNSGLYRVVLSAGSGRYSGIITVLK